MTRGTLVRMTLGFGILVAGGAIAAWGTRGDAMAMAPMDGTAGGLCLPPERVQNAIDRGAAIHVESCAGCHDVALNGAGPSYRAIVDRNRVAGTDAGSLWALSRAASHASPGRYSGYAPLSSPPDLSNDDRDALAYWMWRTVEGR